jgi:hypothetical protein
MFAHVGWGRKGLRSVASGYAELLAKILIIGTPGAIMDL